MDCGIQIFRREDIVKNVQERLTQERETGMWGKPEYQTGKQTPQDRELELISLKLQNLAGNICVTQCYSEIHKPEMSEC